MSEEESEGEFEVRNVNYIGYNDYVPAAYGHTIRNDELYEEINMAERHSSKHELGPSDSVAAPQVEKSLSRRTYCVAAAFVVAVLVISALAAAFAISFWAAATTEPIGSCSELSKDMPSGYYQVRASNGSTIRAYCDMQKTCGGMTGGWMRVVSLDMRQPFSECPSSLCLNTNVPRTCRRCYVPGKSIFPIETYPVGVSYSSVCGRVLAYQVGNPNGYSSYYSNGVDGIIVTRGKAEKMIWTFVAALQMKNRMGQSSMCPCINSSDARISKPPDYISDYYFCDTAAWEAKRSTFYKHKLLWGGLGCQGFNKCCSFNSPPWFYRNLTQPSHEHISLAIVLNSPPNVEDLAIEVMDIYVR